MSQQSLAEDHAPVLWKRCKVIFDMLRSEADNDGLWTGFITKRFEEHYSSPYYGETMYTLEHGLEAIERIRKGSSGNASIILVTKPDLSYEDFIKWNKGEKKEKSRGRLGERIEVLEARANDQSILINNLTERVSDLSSAIAALTKGR